MVNIMSSGTYYNNMSVCKLQMELIIISMYILLQAIELLDNSARTEVYSYVSYVVKKK